MAPKKRKPVRKKFRKVSFKVSSKERSLIEQCSQLEDTTLNKFIKNAIREKVARYEDQLKDQNINHVSDNQLTLFSEKKPGDQISIFDKNMI
ncbi:MAG: hypothetical protein K9H84_05960 [Bacteroidales bacterium]|nr:hypothetical protein [Bacteroidales bacterium]